VVVGQIPVSNDKEVTITQTIDMSLQDNEDDELGGSMPSSITKRKTGLLACCVKDQIS